MKPCLALSIHQPWAWLIVQGIKPVENRTWPVWRRLKPALPFRIYIHAGKTEYDRERLLGMIRLMKMRGDISPLLELPQTYDTMAIVGEATITACVQQHRSPWFTGPFGFVLADPEAYARPVPCRGALGFFKPKL